MRMPLAVTLLLLSVACSPSHPSPEPASHLARLKESFVASALPPEITPVCLQPEDPLLDTVCTRMSELIVLLPEYEAELRRGALAPAMTYATAHDAELFTLRNEQLEMWVPRAELHRRLLASDLQVGCTGSPGNRLRVAVAPMLPDAPPIAFGSVTLVTGSTTPDGLAACVDTPLSQHLMGAMVGLWLAHTAMVETEEAVQERLDAYQEHLATCSQERPAGTAAAFLAGTASRAAWRDFILDLLRDREVRARHAATPKAARTGIVFEAAKRFVHAAFAPVGDSITARRDTYLCHQGALQAVFAARQAALGHAAGPIPANLILGGKQRQQPAVQTPAATAETTARTRPSGELILKPGRGFGPCRVMDSLVGYSPAGDACVVRVNPRAIPGLVRSICDDPAALCSEDQGLGGDLQEDIVPPGAEPPLGTTDPVP